MRDSTNIGEVVALKPDYLGLIFYPKSPRYVEDSLAPGIRQAISDSCLTIGVFVNELLPEIIRKSNLFGFKWIQLHGNESADYCLQLQDLGFTLIKAFGVNEQFDFKKLESYKDVCSYFLFDTRSEAHGGTGKKFDWNLLKNYSGIKPFFLSGGIDIADIHVIRSLPMTSLFALDLNSRFETEPGMKDVNKLHEFFKEINTHE